MQSKIIVKKDTKKLTVLKRDSTIIYQMNLLKLWVEVQEDSYFIYDAEDYSFTVPRINKIETPAWLDYVLELNDNALKKDAVKLDIYTLEGLFEASFCL